MKCEKCGNEYPSNYYFATSTICNECFSKLSPEDQRKLAEIMNAQTFVEPYSNRIGFGRRLGAILIDYAILIVLILVIYKLTGFFDAFNDLLREANEDPVAIAQAMPGFVAENIHYFYITNILMLIYFSLEILIGASIGKLLLGIQIAREDGKKASYLTLLARYSLKEAPIFLSTLHLITKIAVLDPLSTLTNLAIIIGCFFVLAVKRQAFHDMIAKTAVFYKSDVLLPE